MTHLSGPLQCTIQFTNIAPKLTPISVGQFNTLSDSPILHPNTHPFEVGHYNTQSNSPKLHPNTHPFRWPLQYTIWFTNIAPKYPPILVGHYNMLCDSPILLPNSYPFQWATQISLPIHQYCTQIPTHVGGPLWYHVIHQYQPILLGHYNAQCNSTKLHPNTHSFEWATTMHHLVHQYCTQISTHFSEPLWYTMWFTNITPKLITIYFSGSLKYLVWFTNIAPKYAPILVGHYNTLCDSPILLPNPTAIHHSVHQYCTQICTHFSGPLQYLVRLTHIAPTYPSILVGYYDTPSNSPKLHPNTHPFWWANMISDLILENCTQILTHFSGPLE
jgi:hypothetical protein